MSKAELFERLKCQQELLQEVMANASIVMMEIDEIIRELKNEKQSDI